MSLSDKIMEDDSYVKKDFGKNLLYVKDVKEAIKELKDFYPCVKKIRKCYSGDNWICVNCSFRFKIDEIFGEKLT